MVGAKGMLEAMSTISSKTSEGDLPYLIPILGPTGIGKSGLAIELARRFGTDIINADSRQFYHEMKIGTARPSLEEQKGVPHHLMGDRSLTEAISAGDYEKEALSLLQDLFKEKSLVFLVGGSGLYIDALLYGIDKELPASDPKIREELDRRFEEEGLDPLLEELRSKDPAHYQRVDRNNPRRIIRALEVIRSSGSPYSSFRKGHTASRPFKTLKIGLWAERSELHKRIEDRVDQMLEEGLIEEVRSLLPFRDHRVLQSVGYQELFPYLDGTSDLRTARERIERNTRRYAKRQMTWFRRDPEIAWFGEQERERILPYIEERTGIKAPQGPTPSDT